MPLLLCTCQLGTFFPTLRWLILTQGHHENWQKVTQKVHISQTESFHLYFEQHFRSTYFLGQFWDEISPKINRLYCLSTQFVWPTVLAIYSCGIFSSLKNGASVHDKWKPIFMFVLYFDSCMIRFLCIEGRTTLNLRWNLPSEMRWCVEPTLPLELTGCLCVIKLQHVTY